MKFLRTYFELIVFTIVMAVILFTTLRKAEENSCMDYRLIGKTSEKCITDGFKDN